MKTIKFNCPRCNQSIEAPMEIVNTQVACPTCSYEFAPQHESFWIKQLVIARNRPVAVAVAIILSVIAVRSVRGYFTANDDMERRLDIQLAATNESELDRSRRWEREAKASMEKEIEKETLGFTRIVDSWIATSENHPSKWKGQAQVEFLKDSGGIGRKTLYCGFTTISGTAYCISAVDWDPIKRK